MRKSFLTLFLCFGILAFLNAQGNYDPSIKHDLQQIKIENNKKVVIKKAKKKLLGMCENGYKIKRVELYKGLYKIHFNTKCKQSGEVHYYAESAEYKKTICD